MNYALRDITDTLVNLRSWGYLAYKQIHFDYRRNFLGSLWIALGFGLTAAGIGAIMSQLQGQDIREHIPYVMFGFAAWNFVLSVVQASCNVLVGARPFLLQMPLTRSSFILSLTLRNLYLFGIHFGTAAIITLAIGWRPTLFALWAIPAILVYVVAALGVGLMLGHICARLPDLGQLVNSVMRLSFFFTPVIWVAAESPRGTSGGLVGFLMTWNPFTHILAVFRDALLGYGPSAGSWTATIAIAITLLCLGLITLQLMGRRITYWL